MGKDVAILIGSDSDLEFLHDCIRFLADNGIEFDCHALSAHRAPKLLLKYLEKAEQEGVQVYIAAAGGAAHLPGVIASHTIKPVIGVPIPTTTCQSLDSILSILQMPGGVPVATVAASKSGAKNAAILACQILALKNEKLRQKLIEFKQTLEKEVLDKDKKIQEKIDFV